MCRKKDIAAASNITQSQALRIEGIDSEDTTETHRRCNNSKSGDWKSGVKNGLVDQRRNGGEVMSHMRIPMQVQKMLMQVQKVKRGARLMGAVFAVGIFGALAGCGTNSEPPSSESPTDPPPGVDVEGEDEDVQKLLLNSSSVFLEDYELRVSKTGDDLAIFELSDQAANTEEAQVPLGESATIFGVTFEPVEFAPANLDTDKEEAKDAMYLYFKVLETGGEIEHPAYHLEVGDIRTIMNGRDVVRAGDIWIRVGVDENSDDLELFATTDADESETQPVEPDTEISLFNHRFLIAEVTDVEVQLKYLGATT